MVQEGNAAYYTDGYYYSKILADAVAKELGGFVHLVKNKTNTWCVLIPKNTKERVGRRPRELGGS